MSKKKGLQGGPSTLKVIIFNIIIAACCIASIITLYLGDFMKADLTISINKDTITKMMGGSEAQNSGIKAAGEEGGMGMDEILSYLGDDFNLSFTISFQLEGKTIAKGAMGADKATEAVKDLIDKQVDNLVTEIEAKVDDVIEVSVEAIIRYAAEEAKKAVREELAKAEAEGDVTEAQINAKLAEEGISDFNTAIDEIIDGFAETLKSLLNGDKDAVSNFFRTNETLNKFARIAAKEDAESEWQRNHPGQPVDKNSQEYTDYVNQKAADNINELVVEWEKMLDKFSDENGNFSKETLIVSLMNETGLFEEGSVEVPKNAADENGEGAQKKFQSMDDVKAYVIEKIMGTIGEDTVNTIGQVLGYMGYFLFFIMACWAYVLLKIIIKTLFCKNKTVGLFFPRMFGWMPHVFFVGLPMLLIKYLPTVMANPEVLDKANIPADSFDSLNTILDMLQVNVSSLTWVSALCTVILLVLLFMYYPMRRKAKKAKKAAKKNTAATEAEA